MKYILLFAMVCYACANASAQTFTMGKDCRAQNSKGINLLKEKKYSDALETFTAMQKSCKTKDAKEAHAVGRAEALNGLKRYDEAIAASEEALKLTKNKSLMGLFQKAVAQNGLKQYNAASATFSQMMALTEKNKNTKERASNYALMAALQSRQLNHIDSAHYYIEMAIAMDSSNVNYVIQKGDLFFTEKKYDDAFVQYDKAVQMGKADLEMYTIRSNGRLKMVEDKYNTTNAQELRSKMNEKEKQQVCTELNKAISLGLKDMKQDMFASLVCK
jgi:tetratricopeptide (TPR) repeat protein